jgi:hypothetical protein
MHTIRAVRKGLSLFLLLALGAMLSSSALQGDDPKDRQQAFTDYRDVIARTAGMVQDPEARRLAQARELSILNLTWEDTGRFHNSAVGPNISDMTIQVQQIDPGSQKSYLTCMPVIRFPNFSDKTADVKMKKFHVLVGNEKKDDSLRAITLEQYLGNIRKYLSKPGSWKGDQTYLLAQRDEHLLVSAQACFLPVPKQGIAEFNPVLFNYQSRKGDPAVLAIIATREGTSATIIDNQRDGFRAEGGAWGQRLFHNQHGERCSLTGQRLSDFKESGGTTTNPDPSKPTTPQVGSEASLNMVLLIQVPLLQKPQPRLFDNEALKDKAPAKDKDKDKKDKDKDRGKSDVEEAVIGHGKVEGPYTEMDDLEIKRDPKFPIRVTVQFYKATSNGVVSEKDIDEIRKQIQKIYDEGDFVGSLVVGPQTGRPTEYDGDKIEPPDWWVNFWQDYHQRTGLTREQVIEKIREKKGEAWVPLTEASLSVEAEDFAHGWSLPSSWWNKPIVWGSAAAVVIVAIWLLAVRRRPAVGGTT